MRLVITAAALLCCAAAPAFAQQPATPPANPMATVFQRSFTSVADFIVRAAEQMPADKYGYKATADVRSFGEEIGHVADAHYLFCARIRNEANPSTQKIEGGLTGKDELVAKLKESVAYCAGAYNAATDATLAEPFQLPQGRFGTKIGPIANNIAHDNEHYGKIVTYLRLNGLVPPSSQPRS